MESIYSASLKNDNEHDSDNEIIDINDLQKSEDNQRIKQLKQILQVAYVFHALPLYLLFWIADIYYYPAFKWEFLVVRLSYIPAGLICLYLAKKAKSLKAVQGVCAAVFFATAFPIHYMIWRTGDVATPYYVGLNLVLIGMSAGFRFTARFYYLITALIYVPVLIIFPVLNWNFTGLFPLHALFMVGTILIAAVSRQFQERLYQKEFKGRIALAEEVNSRGKIIEIKTNEAIQLSSLAKQFSPQVVHAIRSGKLNLSKSVHRSEICVVFIDIVGSTDRFSRLDREDLDRIITMYMEDTMSTLLKYDVTIDKFLGDGVLAFSNDPIKHDDYIERVLLAVLEIKEKIWNRQGEYDELWMSEFAITVGISSGFANVGFYGSDVHMKSYTAIGRAVNLAARLVSSASPNQILVSSDVVNRLKKRAGSEQIAYEFKDAGFRTLKGFENDQIHVYEFVNSLEVGSSLKKSGGTSELCPQGHGVMFVDVDDQGIFVFKCRTCGLAKSQITSNEIQKKKAS
jgi:adenylate cyclase